MELEKNYDLAKLFGIMAKISIQKLIFFLKFNIALTFNKRYCTTIYMYWNITICLTEFNKNTVPPYICIEISQ